MQLSSPDARRAALRAALLALTKAQRRKVLEGMTRKERAALHFDWRFWARAEQLTPAGAWRYWLVLAGRGFGKTRSGAEFVREQVREGRARHIGLVGQTLAEVREIMINGPDGIMAVSPPEERPVFIESKRLLIWPNGAIGRAYTSEEPNGLRGPGLDLVWGDELAAWKNLDETWTQLDLVLRRTGPLGDPARAMLTTTPRPKAVVRGLLKDPMCHVTRGSTFANAANLDPTFLRKLLTTYEGTRIGRQELYAEVLDDTEGALWTPAMLEACRVADYPRLEIVVVAVDPAVTSGPNSSETGIVAVGGGDDGDVYVLEDASMKGSPEAWGRRVVEVYDRWEADWVVAEVNNGGDLVKSNIHTADPRVPVDMVRATRGKRVRAEPVSALYEKKPPRIHHVGQFPKLEEQLISWTGEEKSPDRMDALVWGVTKIALADLETLNVGFS